MTLKYPAHLTEDALNLHVLGDLPRYQGRLAEEHLSRCKHCREEFNAIAGFFVLFKTAAKRGSYSARRVSSGSRAAARRAGT
jgi:predicted anti-sigma-YlaC factor YlaD